MPTSIIVQPPEPSAYELAQIARIRAWRERPPGFVERAAELALSPLSRTVTGIIPEGAIERVLRASDWLAERMVGPMAAEAATAPLEVLDAEAEAVRTWAIAYAGGEGAIAGAVGLLSLPVDLPTLVALSLRTIRRTGAAYGYDATSETERQFVYAVLSLASANSMRQKRVALNALTGIETRVLAQNWAALGERAARRGAGAEAALLLVRDLAKELGINLSKRKMLAAVPLIGAAIGATLNGWYMRDIADAARRAYQERWLRDRGMFPD
ncbi:MAG: EcsC family protein [Stellaceae bacterium]